MLSLRHCWVLNQIAEMWVLWNCQILLPKLPTYTLANSHVMNSLMLLAFTFWCGLRGVASLLGVIVFPMTKILMGCAGKKQDANFYYMELETCQVHQGGDPPPPSLACLPDKMLNLQRKILMPDISIVGENIEESWKAVRMMENTGSLAVSVLNMRHSTFMGCDGVWQRVLDVGKGWQPGSDDSGSGENLAEHDEDASVVTLLLEIKHGWHSLRH